MIVKSGSSYKVISHTTGRNLGKYKSKRVARKRLQQIAYFKRLGK